MYNISQLTIYAQDLLRLMGKFLIHENVPAYMAASIIEAPREAEVIQPFKKGTFNKSNTQGPSAGPSNSAKRPRIETTSETGTHKKLLHKLIECTVSLQYIDCEYIRFRRAKTEVQSHP